jgi:hypothetical protein
MELSSHSIWSEQLERKTGSGEENASPEVHAPGTAASEGMERTRKRQQAQRAIFMTASFRKSWERPRQPPRPSGKRPPPIRPQISRLMI